MEQYEPLKILGEGSFGKVYLMKHRARRRLVCVKVIKIKNVPKKEREACCQEVNLMQRLSHPNIVGYEESFLSPKQDSLFIVMQYCDGGDLGSRIKAANGQLLHESKVLHWFVQMALGLHHMHINRILHRDLKTQNIFLLGNGRLVLGDLGISKVLEGTADFAETLIGTPYYMSPEIFQNKPYNHKSDIWALGCVLYECVTLNHAFDASSLQGLAAKIIRGRYPPIDERYSSNLRELVAEMLSTDPVRRPDLDVILKRSFVKRHIQDFFVDIMTRPSSSIGEGTMAVRAAALSAVQATEDSGGTNGDRQDAEIESLKRQLEELDLHTMIAKAMRPAEQPTSPRGAMRIAREQVSALRREEERKQVVEETLTKLRAEREERLRSRGSGVVRGGRVPPLARRGSNVSPQQQQQQQQASGRPSPRPGYDPLPSARSSSGGGAPVALNDPRILVQKRASESEDKRRRERKDEGTPTERRKAEDKAVATSARRDSEQLSSSSSSTSTSAERPRSERADRRDSERGAAAFFSREEDRTSPEPVGPDSARSPRSPALAIEGQGLRGPRQGVPSVLRSPVMDALHQRRRPSAEPAVVVGGTDSDAGAQHQHPQVLQRKSPPSGPVKPSHEPASDGESSRPEPASPSGSKELAADRERQVSTSKKSPNGAPPVARSPNGAAKGEGLEDEDEDILDMMVRAPENDYESDLDDDLREREAELQEELEVANKRVEQIKKTLVQTKSFIQAVSAFAAVGAHSAERKGADKGDAETDPGEDEEYDDEVYEPEDDDTAPAKKTSPPRSIPTRKRQAPSPTDRAAFIIPLAEAKMHAHDDKDCRADGVLSETPRSGRLEDRIRDSRALLLRMLGDDCFRKAYAAARELQSTADSEPLDRHEARERSVMAPILKDKLKCLDLLKQLLFCEDSIR